MNLKGRSLVGDSVSRGRVSNDYYATPPSATKQLLDRLKEDDLELKGSILEPACGGGHISDVLIDYYGSDMVTSTDLIDRGYPYMDYKKDFLEGTFDKYDNVITNPPFRYAQEFIEKALTIATDKVIMFAKIQLLEGKARGKFFKSNPPNYIYMFTLQGLIHIEMVYR